jgi:hypothetical protein
MRRLGGTPGLEHDWTRWCGLRGRHRGCNPLPQGWGDAPSGSVVLQRTKPAPVGALSKRDATARRDAGVGARLDALVRAARASSRMQSAPPGAGRCAKRIGGAPAHEARACGSALSARCDGRDGCLASVNAAGVEHTPRWGRARPALAVVGRRWHGRQVLEDLGEGDREVQ